MSDNEIKFYDSRTLKSYNLDEKMRYQLNMLDTLDVYTRRHCENVANLTCRLCEKLHCKKSFTEYCTICAYLHDIGKLFIPASILQKPSRLTDEEYDIMKKHTTLGYEMCMKDLKLRPYAAGPLYHHEALNGTGYPQGLTKKDIPYEGQIIRVADEYDAIVSKRQYKSHIDISDTLKIIIENTIPQDNDQNFISNTLKTMAKDTMPNKDLSTKYSKFGKNSPVIVRTLFKVVIEDIEYEIYCTQSYLDNLQSEIKRLNEVEKYRLKMEKAHKEKDKNYYLAGMKMLLVQGETVENYQKILKEYLDAYKQRKAIIDKLYTEIKIIKKLKV